MDAPTPRKGAKLLANLKRLLLLVVVLVGVLAGNQLYQSSFARQTFTVTIAVEADVTGAGNLSAVRTNELLDLGELLVTIRDRDQPLVQLTLGSSHEATFQTVGRAERDQIEQGRFTAVVRLPQADPDRPQLTFPGAVARDQRIELILTHAAADAFLGNTVEALVTVRNQHGKPLVGLTDRLGELREEGDGVYYVRSKLDDVLWNQLDANETAKLQVTAGESSFRIEFPFAWFLAIGSGSHVVEVQEEMHFERPRLVATRVSPRTVSIDTGWSGSLQVGGENLDLAGDVFLVRGTERIRCRVEERGRGSMRVAVDPAALRPGTYALELETSGEPTVLASALTVQPGFSLLAPDEGAAFEPGDPIPLRWRAPAGLAEVVAELSQPGEGAWRTLYRGPASGGSATGSAEGLAPGAYELRLTAAAPSDLPAQTRRIMVREPAKLVVKLRFQDNGADYYALTDLRIDGERVEPGADPMLVEVKLTKGLHQIRAAGTLGRQLVQTIDVTKAGEIFALDFAR